LLYQLSYAPTFVSIWQKRRELAGFPYTPDSCSKVLVSVGRSSQPFDSGQFVSGRQMCVSHRHLDRLLTHQFSYRAKIHTGHRQAAPLEY
jgi:hypothetical protein